jgi:site-specific recombinase XerD
MATQLEQLKREFLEHIEIEKGRSLKTVKNYDHYITRYFTFSKVQNPEDINSTSVREFRLWLNRQSTGNNRATGKTVSRKTQNYYMIALRVFLKYLTRIKVKSMSAEEIDLAKVPERHIDLISNSELTRLLASSPGGDIKSLRDRSILELLFSTGLRVSELCSLTNDIDFTQGEFSIRGKGGKIRVVFISEEARDTLKKYLKLRKDMADALFVQLDSGNKDNIDIKALDRRSIERIVKQCAVKAGISKKVTPHVIRHCFATDLLSNGADIRSVQMMLGHANIATTQIYTHVTDSQLHDVHKRFHSKR